MGLSKVIMLAIVCLTASSLAHVTLAKNLTKQYLDAHNKARSEANLQPLTWDDTLAAYAENYANQMKGICNLDHSEGPYGENLAGGFSRISPKEAVNLWVEEKQYYDYQSNSCAGGQECGHYTQIVWRDTARVGCARVKCPNQWCFIICSYDPPGNYIGQRPY